MKDISPEMQQFLLDMFKKILPSGWTVAPRDYSLKEYKKSVVAVNEYLPNHAVVLRFCYDVLTGDIDISQVYIYIRNDEKNFRDDLELADPKLFEKLRKMIDEFVGSRTI